MSDLFVVITKSYPELTDKDFDSKGVIELNDDGDGVQYISKWQFDKPLPQGLKLGK